MREVAITVGICVKNSSKTIYKMLESIASQDYPRELVEIIVVDGKSNDGTLEIIKDYLSAFGFRAYYFSDEGKGLGVARQIVADKATGKYVIWVDGDIILPSRYFRSQIDFMEKHRFVGATRGIENILKTSVFLLAVLEYTSKLSYYRDSDKNTLSTFAGTFRTSAMQMVGGFDKRIKGAGEDIDITCRMRDNGWLLRINQTLFYTLYRSTWIDLWNQCIWYGYGAYYVFRKRRSFKDFWARALPAGFLLGIRDFPLAYRAGGAKIALMMPTYRLMKDFFWWLGFLKARFDGYKPETEKYVISIIPFSEELESEELVFAKTERVLVTIGLCVKNCETTIDKTLDCISRQDYPHDLIEFVVIDDKSTDNTIPQIIAHLSSDSFDYRIYHTGGLGLGSARQIVVDKARGKHILWIDGDMVLPKNHVRLQIEFMEKNPSLGKARAIWKILDEKNSVAMLESMRLLKSLTRNRQSSHWQGIGGSICRTEALRGICGFDKKIRGAGEDIDLTVRLAASWKIGLSPAVFYHNFRKTWSGLWNQYVWYGYGMHYVNTKHKGVVKLWTYIPFVASLSAIQQSFEAFNQTRKKVSFLLPFQFCFKYSAWIYGYLTSHLDGYGHARNQTKL